ncbi:hypothetical protein P280DRAFT_466375 [Massarina eburnea CBS 473.64]|uniref:Uncharacterized protein n=1 Tax=Massarina eburnea CBS 473.64 TaxID=1395130 RepID=A0A6A6SFF1_9PLEO|nr:hypothetical protein P280DRAFT_466375 [Massarina eburnea CBS 473.64]
MSWMDSWSRPSKSQATPPPLYLTNASVPYCHSCGRVISQRRTQTTQTKTQATNAHSRTKSKSKKKTQKEAEEDMSTDTEAGKGKKQQEIKYCSARCRNTKPGALDRKIEAVFVALLDGVAVESVMESLTEAPGSNNHNHNQEEEKKKEAETEAEDPTHPIPKKNHQAFQKERTPQKKKKPQPHPKGETRPTIPCTLVSTLIFPHAADPSKTHGRRKNRAARGIVEKPEDWRSVDMVDDPTPPASSIQHPDPGVGRGIGRPDNPGSADETQEESHSSSSSPSEGEEEDAADDPTPPRTPKTSNSYTPHHTRPPQSHSLINGSIGGEKGWSERQPESAEAEASRVEGQRRAQEREMVRRAARRLVAFGVYGGGKDGEADGGRREGKGGAGGKAKERKCEAVMKNAVVEASFAKGEWGVRWREEV